MHRNIPGVHLGKFPRGGGQKHVGRHFGGAVRIVNCIHFEGLKSPREGGGGGHKISNHKVSKGGGGGAFPPQIKPCILSGHPVTDTLHLERFQKAHRNILSGHLVTV